MDYADRDYDLVTTIFPRTFPRGQNAELIRVSSLQSIDQRGLPVTDREHVTTVYYKNADYFRIFNVDSGNPQLAQVSFVVDTVDDLHRLEQLSQTDTRALSWEPVSSRLG